MSYILNALKKSEQERKSKQSASIEDNIMAQSGVRASWRFSPWLIGLLLIINLTALGYFIWTNQGGKEMPAGKATGTSASNQQLTEPQPANIPESTLQNPANKMGAAELQPKPSTPINNANPSSISGLVEKKSSSDKTSKPGIQAAKLSPPETEKQNLSFSAKKDMPDLKPREKPNFAADKKVQAEAQSNSPAISGRSQAITTAPAPEPDKKETIGALKSPLTEKKTETEKQADEEKASLPPLLRELPYEFRRSVPDININVFVYDEAPEERFVIIDMHKHIVGQKLPNNMIIEDILQDSLVVKFKDRVFRIPTP